MTPSELTLGEFMQYLKMVLTWELADDPLACSRRPSYLLGNIFKFQIFPQLVEDFPGPQFFQEIHNWV